MSIEELKKAKERVNTIIGNCNEYYDLTIVDEHINKIEEQKKQLIRDSLAFGAVIKGLNSKQVNPTKESILDAGLELVNISEIYIEKVTGRSIEEIINE